MAGFKSFFYQSGPDFRDGKPRVGKQSVDGRTGYTTRDGFEADGGHIHKYFVDPNGMGKTDMKSGHSHVIQDFTVMLSSDHTHTLDAHQQNYASQLSHD